MGNEVRITWTSIPAVSIADGVGFLLNFNYTGGSCNLRFNQGCEIAGAMGDIIQTTFLDGAINQPAVNTTAKIETQDGQYGVVNELPITFSFSPIPPPTYQVGAINLNISYNSNNLQFVGIVGLPNAIANASNGVISIVWSGTTPVDLVTLNLRLKFNYLGGTSDVNFTGVSIISNPNGDQLPINFINGKINQPSTDAKVEIQTDFANPNGLTSIPVLFSGFPELQSAATMNIAYNSSALNFAGTSGLPGLIANASNGVITFIME